MDATHEDNYIVMGECLLFRKSKHWDYECEWRIIYPDRIEPGGNRLLDYPPQMLTGIIFGCEMSEDDKKTIREMIRKRTHKTRLFQARKKDDEFALDIIEIDWLFVILFFTHARSGAERDRTVLSLPCSRIKVSPIVALSRFENGLQGFLRKRNCNDIEPGQSCPRETVSWFWLAQLYGPDDKMR